MELDLEMAKAGFGGFSGLLENPDPDKEWLATTPGGMMSLYATMLDASADSKDAIAKERLDNAAQAARNLELLEAAKARTRIIGRDNVGGMEVIELGSDDLGMVQRVDDETFTTNTVRISVHADSYVPVRFKIDGILEQGGESRPMTVERIDSGLSTHPGCNNLVVPGHSIMRLGGALTPEQEKELAEAQKQLAEFDKQMTSMPPAQQEMMKRMVGPQIEMIKNMTSGGGIEVKSKLIEVRCNDNMPTSQELAQKLM